MGPTDCSADWCSHVSGPSCIFSFNYRKIIKQNVQSASSGSELELFSLILAAEYLIMDKLRREKKLLVVIA